MPAAPGLTFDGRRLRRARLEQRELAGDEGWTAAEVGRRLGVSHAAVLRWEQGQRIPELHHLRALCRLFDLDPWDLIPPPSEGPHLIHLRVRSYLTQQQIADRLKVAIQTYSSVETGERPLTETTANDLAKWYRVRIDDIETAYSRTITWRSTDVAPLPA